MPARFVLPRQRRRSCQEFIDCVRGLTALADRPHHQRLAAPHVAASEYFGMRASIDDDVGLDIATWIELETKRGDHAFVYRMHEAHGEQNEISLDVELGSRNRLELGINPGAVQRPDMPVFSGKADGADRKVTRGAFLVAR